MLTDSDNLAELLEIVIRRSATKLSIKSAGDKGVGELLKEVRRQDPETYSLLEAFADAYLDWYRWRRQAVEGARSQPSGGQQSGHLADLIHRCDAARDALLRRLQRL